MARFFAGVRGARYVAAMVVAVGLGGGGQAHADFPGNRPVQAIVPYPAGGSLDTVIRPISEAFNQATGQAMVVENVGGAGGLIGAGRVVSAKPDGHTLLVVSSGQVSIAPFLYPDMSYDPQTDLVPIVHLVDQPAVLYASAKSPYQSLQDVLDAARRAPGQLDMASTGIGSISHLAQVLFAQKTDTEFSHVPYRGAAPALQDLAGGQVPLLFTFVGSAKPLTEAGAVRPIAVAAPQRLAGLPQVPTFAELGHPDVVASVWIGLMAPKGTPEPVIEKLASLVQGAAQKPGFQERMAASSAEVRATGPREFAAMIVADRERWAGVADSIDLQDKP